MSCTSHQLVAWYVDALCDTTLYAHDSLRIHDNLFVTMSAMYDDAYEARKYILYALKRRGLSGRTVAYVCVYLETVLDMLLSRFPTLQYFAVAMDEAFAPVDAALAIVRAHGECKCHLG